MANCFLSDLYQGPTLFTWIKSITKQNDQPCFIKVCFESGADERKTIRACILISFLYSLVLYLVYDSNTIFVHHHIIVSKPTQKIIIAKGNIPLYETQLCVYVLLPFAMCHRSFRVQTFNNNAGLYISRWISQNTGCFATQCKGIWDKKEELQ